MCIRDSHRMDALLKLSKFKQHQNPNHTGEEAYNFFMIAIFPTSQARILDYNRLIKDLYGYSPKDFIKEIKKKFKVEKQNSAFKPKKSQIFGMYLEKQWYSLELKEKPHQNIAYEFFRYNHTQASLPVSYTHLTLPTKRIV